jgi:hypothetical protein
MRKQNNIFVFVLIGWLFIQAHNIIPHHHHNFQDIIFEMEHHHCSHHHDNSDDAHHHDCDGDHHNHDCDHGESHCRINIDDILLSQIDIDYIPVKTLELEYPDEDEEDYFEIFNIVSKYLVWLDQDRLRGPPLV